MSDNLEFTEDRLPPHPLVHPAVAALDLDQLSPAERIFTALHMIGGVVSEEPDDIEDEFADILADARQLVVGASLLAATAVTMWHGTMCDSELLNRLGERTYQQMFEQLSDMLNEDPEENKPVDG